MPLALEHIRRMRGGAQAHLMRCSDSFYYVVKFQNNPQHPRILANELLGTQLAARLGLLTPPVAVIEVPQRLIDSTADLVMQVGATRTPCRAGLHFGSRYPGNPAEVTVEDFLPDGGLRNIDNITDFLGMLVFDKWTCNTNGRQVIFFLEPGRSNYQALMIDQGFCFNAGDWSFPDAPLRGLYARHRVYESVRGMKSFEPWLERLKKQITERVLDDVDKRIPPQWYDFDQEALFHLLERLYRRRKQVADLILAAKNSGQQPFANWK
jgi:hypothetical protein